MATDLELACWKEHRGQNIAREDAHGKEISHVLYTVRPFAVFKAKLKYWDWGTAISIAHA